MNALDLRALVLRAAALLVLVAAGALACAGCRPTPVADARALLRYQEPFTCAQSLTDLPCIACLKQHCCQEATACNGKRPEMCPCAATCIGEQNTQACADRCAAAQDRAFATCSVQRCAQVCPTASGTG